MKRLSLLLIFAFTIGFTSCKKEDVSPTPVEQAVEIDEEISLFGEWLLVGGKMYMENIETNEKVVYDHFSNTKIQSSLRYSGSMYEFEDIEINETTWSFSKPPMIPGYGNFILNGDTTKPLGLYITNSNWTIVENPQATNFEDMHLGGSARPISAYILSSSDSTVNFYVQEAYEGINGQNWKYFSELTFVKKG